MVPGPILKVPDSCAILSNLAFLEWLPASTKLIKPRRLSSYKDKKKGTIPFFYPFSSMGLATLMPVLKEKKGAG